MQELLPLACGLLLGLTLGFVRPRLRLPLGVGLAIVLGTLATVVTGEFKTSWGYLLVDIPLVAVAAFLGFLSARHLRPATWRSVR
jgi:hypothetical protein